MDSLAASEQTFHCRVGKEAREPAPRGADWLAARGHRHVRPRKMFALLLNGYPRATSKGGSRMYISGGVLALIIIILLLIWLL
jgi:hypothetical protein